MGFCIEFLSTSLPVCTGLVRYYNLSGLSGGCIVSENWGYGFREPPTGTERGSHVLCPTWPARMKVVVGLRYNTNVWVQLWPPHYKAWMKGPCSGMAFATFQHFSQKMMPFPDSPLLKFGWRQNLLGVAAPGDMRWKGALCPHPPPQEIEPYCCLAVHNWETRKQRRERPQWKRFWM